MTSLNSKLQLALINRKKGRNILEKGFTLVELMIVIVIVGILSAVALPSFLGQQNKAKLTEATSKLSSILKSAHAEYTYDNNVASAFIGATDGATSANKSGKFVYNTDGDNAADATAKDSTAGSTTNEILYIKAAPITDITAKGYDKGLVDEAVSGDGSNRNLVDMVYACVNLDTGKLSIGRSWRADRSAATATDTGDVDCNS